MSYSFSKAIMVTIKRRNIYLKNGNEKNKKSYRNTGMLQNNYCDCNGTRTHNHLVRKQAQMNELCSEYLSVGCI